MTGDRNRIAIIGAGPIGLEAALCAAHAGYQVDVYERGSVAEHMQRWGHVRLFSPFGMNSSELGRRSVSDHAGGDALPGEDALLTGNEFAERYLLPVSRLPLLEGGIHQSCRVTAVGRTRTWKGDLIGRPERGDDPFKLLLSEDGWERTATADIVLDCSGTYANANNVGAGGVACLGESTALSADDYRLPDILGEQRDRYAGRTTIVIGAGYSAATAIVSLAELAESAPGTRAIWITRAIHDVPIGQIKDDQLISRDVLATRANELALEQDGIVEWKPARLVRRVVLNAQSANDARNLATHKYTLTLECRSADDDDPIEEQLRGDNIIANVGYRPDRSLYEELQVHECYASQGPMKLSAALLGEQSADCLDQGGFGAGVLSNPEPGFFILGAKSYGRDSRFLIKIGLEQIRDVFEIL